MNGLTILVAIGAFFIGRYFQYLLTQSSDSKWQRKPKYSRTPDYKKYSRTPDYKKYSRTPDYKKYSRISDYKNRK
jgi:hypothetical protein